MFQDEKRGVGQENETRRGGGAAEDERQTEGEGETSHIFIVHLWSDQQTKNNSEETNNILTANK